MFIQNNYDHRLKKIQMAARFISLFLFLSASVFAQKFGEKFGENQIIGTKWRYTYTLHLESNTTVHQADKEYQYFLFFKYDYTFEQYLHGQFSKGTWSLNNNTLFYNFRNVPKFDIVAVNNKTLVLEFKQPNTTGTYQYHFVSVESSEAPFVRPVNELPEIIVEAPSKNKKKRHWWDFLSTTDEKKSEQANTRKDIPYISVELIGGGYYGGIDPVIKDFTRINSDGRLIHEFQTVNAPLHLVKKNISRTELQQFAEFISDNKFFDMQRLYDCNSEVCEKRKLVKPTPIPLRLMVCYGDKKKVITISIWGEDNRKIHYVNYPQALDNIIDAIQKLANRPDDARIGNVGR